MNRKEQKRKYWLDHYKAFIKSGLTQRDYCRNNELGYYAFNTWKRTFDKSAPDKSFQELPFKISENGSSSANQVEIILPNKIRLAIPENFSSATLKKIIIALGELK